MNLRKLKNELLCLGARIEEEPDRTGGAGPSDATFIKIDNLEVSVPSRGIFSKSSPYLLKKINGKLLIIKDNKELCLADKVSYPDFYKNKTSDGIEYRKIFLPHGKKCIGTTVFQSCSFWSTSKGCKFCGIGLSLKTNTTIPVKTPEHLYEVAESAVKEGYEHAVLTTGSQKDEEFLFNYLIKCVNALAELPLNIQVQVSPPENLSFLEGLKIAGVDTIAINIESFDDNVLRISAPRKAEIGLRRYFKTLEYAVQIFGKNQVVSFVLAGLGETLQSIIDGSEKLSEVGVYPFIVPFRPIRGTPYEDINPPSPEYIEKINSEVAKILIRKGLSYRLIMAGCGRCTCCSALPDYEES